MKKKKSGFVRRLARRLRRWLAARPDRAPVGTPTAVYGLLVMREQ